MRERRKGRCPTALLACLLSAPVAANTSTLVRVPAAPPTRPLPSLQALRMT